MLREYLLTWMAEGPDEILVVLYSDDIEGIAMLEEMDLPDHVQVICFAHRGPRPGVGTRQTVAARESSVWRRRCIVVPDDPVQRLCPDLGARGGSSGKQLSTISSGGNFTCAADVVSTEVGNSTCVTGSTSCTVKSLKNGTGYTFQVVATNRIGDSYPSAASTAATPLSRKELQRRWAISFVRVKFAAGKGKLTWRAKKEVAKFRVRISKPNCEKYRKWNKAKKRFKRYPVSVGKRYPARIQPIVNGYKGKITTVRFVARRGSAR